VTARSSPFCASTLAHTYETVPVQNGSVVGWATPGDRVGGEIQAAAGDLQLPVDAQLKL
jgi:hypothetical protein